jgi:hypothetical protein
VRRFKNRTRRSIHWMNTIWILCKIAKTRRFLFCSPAIALCTLYVVPYRVSTTYCMLYSYVHTSLIPSGRFTPVPWYSIHIYTCTGSVREFCWKLLITLHKRRLNKYFKQNSRTLRTGLP